MKRTSSGQRDAGRVTGDAEVAELLPIADNPSGISPENF
jgi:hypothetical protein